VPSTRRRSLWADLALPIAFVVIGVGVASREHGRLERRPVASSQSVGPYGVRAFYQALVDAGFLVQRHHATFHDLPRGAPYLLVVAAPSGEPVTAEESARLLEWVGDGNVLLYLADGEASFEEGLAADLPDRRLLERIGVTLLPPLGLPYDPSRLDRIPEVPPVVPGPCTHGCRGIFSGSSGGAVCAIPLRLPLYGDRGIEYAMLIPYRAGRVFFFASVAPIANRSIGLADNARALLAVVHSIDGLRAVLFDEYHHERAPRHTWSRILAHPAFQLAGIQALVLLALWLWVAGRRFGPLVEPPEERRRSSIEYVSSMASLYRRAGPSGAILQAILRGVRYDLWRRHGVPAKPGEGAAARLAAIAGRPVGEVRALLTQCEALAARPRVGRDELLGAARRLHDTFERKGP